MCSVDPAKYYGKVTFLQKIKTEEEYNENKWNSPLRIREDELPKFEIPQHDALLVTRRDGLSHLPEQSACLVLS